MRYIGTARAAARSLIAAAALGAMLAPASSSMAQDADPAPLLRPVKLMTVEAESAWPTRRFFGRVVARSTVDLSFQVSGEIKALDAEEGDLIAANETLAQLDLEPFELAFRSADLSLQQAEREFQRLETVGPSVTAQANIDDAETARDLAAVRRREAERDLEEATLVAPFDALIATRYVDAFTTVEAGSRVIRVHDMSELRVEIDVPETLFRIAQGAEDFNIYATILGEDKKYPLVEREFNAETTDIGQSYVITLAFTDDLGDRILPGATVTVVAEPKVRLDALYLPSSAVIIAPDNALSVMLFEEGEGEGVGAVRRVDITADTSLGGSRIRAASGLNIGDRIVAAGPGRLENGQKVRIFEGFGQ